VAEDLTPDHPCTINRGWSLLQAMCAEISVNLLRLVTFLLTEKHFMETDSVDRVKFDLGIVRTISFDPTELCFCPSRRIPTQELGHAIQQTSWVLTGCST